MRTFELGEKKSGLMRIFRDMPSLFDIYARSRKDLKFEKRLEFVSIM